MQLDAPFSAPLKRLEDIHRGQIHSVVDLLLGGTLSACQRGLMENIIITKVPLATWTRKAASIAVPGGVMHEE